MLLQTKTPLENKMNLIERVASKAFYDNGHLYHSIDSARGFFEAKCKEFGLDG